MSACPSISSLEAELAEAKKFISLAQQPGVKQLLSQFIVNFDAALKELRATEVERGQGESVSIPSSSASTSTSPAATIKQVSITSYSWDETDTEVKIYLKCPSCALLSNSPTAKIVVTINTNADEKTLKIDFIVFYSSTSSPSSSSSTPSEIHSFVVHPLKHELETVNGTYELERSATRSNDNNCDDNVVDSFGSSWSFSTPKTVFVYPGERTTPSGGVLRYCRMKVKPNGDVVVGIQKVMPGPWSDLIDKDDFNKPLAFGNSADERRSRSDPAVQHTASLVSLMQQLYRDGDDEMKKTIANAWEESRTMQ